MLRLEAYALTDVGKKRNHNEDYLGDLLLRPDSPRQFPAEKLRERGQLFAVADGMGGHASGEVASKLAISTLFQGYYNTPLVSGLGEHLIQAVRTANLAVYNAGKTNPLGAMGTTLTLAAFRGNVAMVSNVGDSRTYLMRRGQIRQITRDHSLVQEQVDMGLLAAADMSRSPIKNYITRAIGHKPIVEPDYFEHVLHPDDFFLLCSDGLHGKVREVEIPGIISTAANLKEAAVQLIQLANDRGGPDNISVLLVRVLEVGEPGLVGSRSNDYEVTDRTAVAVPPSRMGVADGGRPALKPDTRTAPTQKLVDRSASTDKLADKTLPENKPANQNEPTTKLPLPPTPADNEIGPSAAPTEKIVRPPIPPNMSFSAAPTSSPVVTGSAKKVGIQPLWFGLVGVLVIGITLAAIFLIMPQTASSPAAVAGSNPATTSVANLAASALNPTAPVAAANSQPKISMIDKVRLVLHAGTNSASDFQLIQPGKTQAEPFEPDRVTSTEKAQVFNFKLKSPTEGDYKITLAQDASFALEFKVGDPNLRCNGGCTNFNPVARTSTDQSTFEIELTSPNK